MSVYQVRTVTFPRRATTSATVVYTAPQAAHGVQMVSIYACERQGSAATLTVEYVDAAASQAFFLAFEAPIAANGAFIQPLEGLALRKGDQIRISAGAANSVDVFLTVKETASRSI